MWDEISDFKIGDFVKVQHCGDLSTSTAKINKVGGIYEITILEGTEVGRTYDVYGSMKATLIQSA